MRKNYDHKYLFAGGGSEYGLMVCDKCGLDVDSKTQDFVVYKKREDDDWGYVTIHRGCYHTQEKWEAQERKEVKKQAIKDARLRDPNLRKHDLLSELLNEYTSVLGSAYCQVNGDSALIDRVRKELMGE